MLEWSAVVQVESHGEETRGTPTVGLVSPRGDFGAGGGDTLSREARGCVTPLPQTTISVLTFLACPAAPQLGTGSTAGCTPAEPTGRTSSVTC